MNALRERELSLKRSSELNDAYRVLRDPLARLEYLLGIEGQRKEDKRAASAAGTSGRSFSVKQSLDQLRDKESGEDFTAKISCNLPRIIFQQK